MLEEKKELGVRDALEKQWSKESGKKGATPSICTKCIAR